MSMVQDFKAHARQPVTVELLSAALDVVIEELRAAGQRAKTLESCVSVLEDRLRRLETEPHVKFAGPYDGTRTYACGEVVVDKGSGWICLAGGTTTRPSESAPWQRHWALIAKCGRDGRDRRDGGLS